jgi:catechol 2,3-dioxygenase-like lactoylglutathione lyase family enzyme
MTRMVRFYRDVLGAQYVAFRPKFNMAHLRVGESLIDLVVAEAGGGRNMDHFCLQVDPFDPQEIIAHLKGHGVEVDDVTTRYGAQGNGPSIYLFDPEGNQVELKGPSDGKPPPD